MSCAFYLTISPLISKKITMKTYTTAQELKIMTSLVWAAKRGAKNLSVVTFLEGGIRCYLDNEEVAAQTDTDTRTCESWFTTISGFNY